MLPARVKIVEVGPRDGLQNEAAPVPSETKIRFIDRLTAAGLPVIEATSFVSPAWVPQLADAADVMAGIRRREGTLYPVLVPNVRGMERALSVGVTDVAVFTAASETFNQRNINASIAESLQRFEPVMELARANNVRVRGYISCVLGCPYEGYIAPAAVASVAADLLDLGCYELSLGDTIGVGTPNTARAMLSAVAEKTGMERLAIHFHDTRGQALANAYACLELGVATIDASVAGLGGCPYAGGATGNVATEDLIYMLHGMRIETGVNLRRLVAAGQFISSALGRKPNSRLGQLPPEKLHDPAENTNGETQ